MPPVSLWIYSPKKHGDFQETVQGQNYSADSGLRGYRVNGRKVYRK